LNIEEWSGYEVSNEALSQAASWIALLDNPDSSERDEQLTVDETQMSGASEDVHTRFFNWLQADPSHQQAYFELSEMWARTACTKSMSDMIENSVVLPFPAAANSLSVDPDFAEQTASSSWAYSLTIGIILCGLMVPAIQSLF
jgi:ferric-dicitrate binding protein FerR (iron transport regulator)